MSGEDERRTGKPGSEGPPPARSSGPSDREREPPATPPPPREARSPLDLVPEILRRGLSAGRDVSDALFPRELASNLAAQLVDARHGLVTAIATEVGRFLRQADIASEMRKVLAGLNVEAKIQLRFSEDPKDPTKTKLEVERTPPAPAPARKPPKPPPTEL